MTAQRFTTGACFLWLEKPYEVKRVLPGKKASIEHIISGDVQTVDISVLETALFAEDLHFFVPDKLAKSKQKSRMSIESKYSSLTECPDHLVAIAKHRQKIVEELLELKRKNGKLTRDDVKRHLEKVNATLETFPERKLLGSASPASAYRWMKSYLQCGNDLRALIPDTDCCGGKRKARLSPDVHQVIEQTIDDMYFKRETVTIDDVFNEVATRIDEQNGNLPTNEKIKAPSRSTVVRRIEALDVAHKFAAKHGKRAASLKFKQYGQMQNPELPLERVEIDHTRSDLIVIDDHDNLPLGRLTLTYCIDTATKYPLGYYMGFEPYSYLAVMECLYHTIRPKGNIKEKYGTEHDWIAYGVPSTLVIDGGREFIGKDLQDACFLLGVTLERTPVRTPYLKPDIERLFGTLNTMFFHTFPGTTFSNVQKRGDYDSLNQACVYLSDIDKMMNIFIVDKYAERFHRGLGGIPARRWELATQSGFLPRVPRSAKELKVLLSRVEKRVIWHYGIDLESIRYSTDDPRLTRLRTRLKGEKATIKYHPGDLSRIYVYDPDENNPDEDDSDEEKYIEVPAINRYQEYTQGLSLWKHRVIRNAILEEQHTVDPIALGRTKRKLQAIVDAGRERKRAGTRNRGARWNSSGKPTRDMSEDRADEKEVEKHQPQESKPSSLSPVVTVPLNSLNVSLEEAEAEGWGIEQMNSVNVVIDQEIQEAKDVKPEQ